MNASRRNFNKLLALIPTIPYIWSRDAEAKAYDSDKALLTVPGPTIETTDGKISGYIRNGIHTFKGIPYASSPTGENRFKPAQRLKPRAGSRPSLAYGAVCPQAKRVDWKYENIAFLFDWDEGYQDENCLSLNIWTPSADTYKRPVMVWIHGGYFETGSSHELPSYDGERLSHRGDVVVVSVNHRLGLLGHLNLGDTLGEDYRSSANVGVLDLILALEWIRDNISQFGGNPNNITLFGQSGGGYKISTLMIMPLAKGLFHKAIVQSGSRPNLGTVEDSLFLTEQLLRELSLTKASVRKIQGIPTNALIEAGVSIQKKISDGKSKEYKDRFRWQPVVDEQDIPSHLFDTKALALSSHVPMLVGSTMHEWNPSVGDHSLASIDMAKLHTYLHPRFGERTSTIIDAYKRENPLSTPIELLSLIISPRTHVISHAEAKFHSGKAPVYMYWFGWRPPVFEGKPLAFHGVELPFVFDNASRAASITGGGSEALELAARVSSSWVAFARHGDPNLSGSALSHWERFTPSRGQTMVISNNAWMENDPDRKERYVLEGRQGK
ncbi:para-nitrobenzyl esterase [Azotobacter beijerinckii]|uniref:Carboxylic ester hydrolase n=1 Tax=Azotobacter beijerinckii TaxID=170623 RepID=A0A1H8ZYP3_9GAMM|nr:carboxylesterase family protein [Azotobacter beijerinckii]SEP69465.1 para-nitrobenzyl esterase [Azotobacter beijerinckii]